MVITSAFQADDEGSIPFFRLEVIIPYFTNAGLPNIPEFTEEDLAQIEADLDPNEWLYKMGLKTLILGISEALRGFNGYIR